MSLDVRTVGDVTILSPHGMMFGGKETDELEAKVRELNEQGNMKLLINLSGVTFMTSIPIKVLFWVHGKYAMRGATVKICDVDKRIHQIFVIVRLTLVYGENLHVTEEEALASFRRYPSLAVA